MGFLMDNIFGFPKVTDTQKPYNFEVLMPFSYGGIFGILVSRYCQSVTFGEYSLKDLHRLQYGAEKRSYAKDMDITSITMTFIVPNPDIVARFFHKWREVIVDNDGLHGKKVDYARQIHIALQHNSGIPSNILKCYGVFPIKMPKYAMSYGKDGVLQYQIEFSVDKVETKWF